MKKMIDCWSIIFDVCYTIGPAVNGVPDNDV